MNNRKNNNIYFFSWFDDNNDGIVDGNMIKNKTMTIDGVNYTFDIKGVCQNPPSELSH